MLLPIILQFYYFIINKIISIKIMVNIFWRTYYVRAFLETISFNSHTGLFWK